MSTAYDVWAVLLLVAVAVATRAGYMLVGAYLPLPDSLRRALRYAPVAALTAILVSDLLPWRAGVGPVFDYKLLAGAVGVLVFLRTRSSVLVILAGMASLWLLRWVASAL